MQIRYKKNYLLYKRHQVFLQAAVYFVILFNGLLCQQLVAQATTVYSSPVPANNNSVKKEDMVYIDYGYFARLKKDLTNGIKAVPGQPSSAVTKVKLYEYNPAAPGGKGHQVFYIYLNENELQTISTSQYAGHADEILKDVFQNPYGHGVTNVMPVYVKSDDIQRLAQDALADPMQPAGGLPYCNIVQPAKTWKQTFSQIWDDLTGNASATQNCIVKFRYTPVQPVIVEIETDNKDAIDNVKIPGIVGGNLFIRDNRVVTAPVSPVQSYCATHPGTPLCTLYSDVQHPNYNPGTMDIMMAVHRGYWGYDLGNSSPENTTESVKAGFELMNDAKITEMDITATGDGQLVMLHDYVMNRLTDYPGEKFSFELTRYEIEQYKVRKRNGAVSREKVTRFEDVLDYVNSVDGILMLDIKEKQSKGKDPNCTANCDYQTKEAQSRSFKEIAASAIKVAREKGMLQNLVIKTYLSFKETRDLLGVDAYSIMWTPMLLSNRPDFQLNIQNPDGTTVTAPDIDKMCAVIDEWNRYAPELICSYETDFFVMEENNLDNTDPKKRNPADVMLKQFSRGGADYTNLLHYIYAKTGRRSGIFSEEPVGPRGTVNRWAGWSIKDTRKDMRGDHFRLLAVPYGNIMLICTDRIDVWKEINSNFNTSN